MPAAQGKQSSQKQRRQQQLLLFDNNQEKNNSCGHQRGKPLTDQFKLKNCILFWRFYNNQHPHIFALLYIAKIKQSGGKARIQNQGGSFVTDYVHCFPPNQISCYLVGFFFFFWSLICTAGRVRTKLFYLKIFKMSSCLFQVKLVDQV